MQISVQLILEVSAFASILSTIMSYVIFQKKTGLKYIIERRQKWRDSVRKIAKKIGDCPYKKRKQVLFLLYDKIDANGLVSDSLFEDSHIWDLIKKIENCDKKDYLELKRNLLKSLSLKLDYDWRCSERDIKGEPAKIVSLIMLLLAMCFATYEVYRLEPMQTDIPTLLVDVVPITALFLFATTILKLCEKKAVKTVGDIAILAGVLIAVFFIRKEQLITQYPYIYVALVFVFFAAGINFLIVFDILLDDFFYIRDIKKQLIKNEKSRTGKLPNDLGKERKYEKMQNSQQILLTISKKAQYSI